MPHDSALERVTADDADVETRRAAAREAFERTRQPPRERHLDADDLPAIADTLDDPDDLVRGHAAAALGDLAFQESDYDEPVPHLPALLELLTDDSAAVRQTVLGVLHNRPDRALWRDPSARSDGERVRELAAVGMLDCFDAGSDVVRRRAGGYLSASLVADHPEFEERAVPTVVERLDDPVPRVREVAGDVLAEVAAEHPSVLERHVEALTDHLDADRPDVRLSAARSLGPLADDHPDAVDGVVDVLVSMLDADDRHEREAAAEAVADLAARQPGVVERVLEPLIEQLSSPDRNARADAAAQLARLAAEYPEAVPDPLVALADARSDGVELADNGVVPLTVLAENHPDFAAERLVRMAERLPEADGLPTGRGLECRRMADVDPTAVEPAVGAVTEQLDADNETVRERAIHTLGDLAEHHPDLVAPIADRLVAALATLEAVPTSGSTGALFVAVRDPDAVLPVPESLRDHLASAETGTRHGVASLLGSLGHDRPDAVPDVARTLAGYLEEEHTDHLGDPERLQYVLPANEYDYDEPLLKDDPAWPLGVLADEHPDLVETAVRNCEAAVADADWWGLRKAGEAMAEVATARPDLLEECLPDLADVASDPTRDESVRAGATAALATVAEVDPDVVRPHVPEDLPDDRDEVHDLEAALWSPLSTLRNLLPF